MVPGPEPFPPLAESADTSHPAMPPTFRVLLTDRAWPDSLLEQQILGRIGAELMEPPDTATETLKRLAGDCDAIGTCWAPVPAELIDAAPRLRCISRFGIGLDNIDVARATARGIPVANVPDYCVDEVADHTIALLLAIARRVAWHHLETKRGEYRLQSGREPRRLSTQVLGLVGLGRIGRAVYTRARALGLQVQAWARSGNDGGTGCPLVSFEELLATSDFVSLHVPLTVETGGLLGAAQLARMQPGAAIINTSRGGLVDHAALHAALQNEHLSAAALDVFDPEPPDLDQPLFRDERVIATPHSAFLSRESLEELRTRATTHLVQALQGERPAEVVNPAIYEQAD